MHGEGKSTARKEVDAASPQLSSAGTGQDEAQAPRLDEAMNLVEEFRNLLDFVQDNPAFMVAGNTPFEAVGSGKKLGAESGFEEGEIDGVGETLPHPTGLAGAAWSEQEKTLGIRRVEDPGEHEAIFSE